eukprot:Gb_02634 [translate_table: standard]
MEDQVSVPPYLRCPISLDLMQDPVTLCTGITYDRQSITTWLDAGNNICPVTNQTLQSQELIPNHALRRFIQDWRRDNHVKGIENIVACPTVPLNAARITQILVEASSGKTEAIKTLRAFVKESETNIEFIVSAGAPFILASLFSSHSLEALEKSEHSLDICEEVLETLAMFQSVNDEARGLLASSNALRCITSILIRGNPERKTNAALLLRKSAADHQYRERMGDTDGLAEGLVGLLKESPCPAATKASITTIFYIGGGGSATIRVKMVEAGAVALLLEILPEANKSICERSMAALDVLCNCPEGLSAAYEHALTIPVIVKKILRVSELASKFAVSVLWTICQKRQDDCVLSEALQVGAFQKLLVILQIGYGGQSRERATELLKLLDKYRDDCECQDTMNMKQLRRSF